MSTSYSSKYTASYSFKQFIISTFLNVLHFKMYPNTYTIGMFSHNLKL